MFAPADIAVSADGRRIAALMDYRTDGVEGEFYKLVVHTDGQRRLQRVPLKGPTAAAVEPSLALSPNGRTLAISIGGSIQLADLASGHRKPLRRAPGPFGFDVQLSFTADGHHLVFCHGADEEGGDADIYEIDLDGTHLRRLTQTPANEYFPELSPDGRQPAFLRRARYHEFDLILANADDTEEHVVGRTGFALGGPHFPPDGRRIVFAAAKRTEENSPLRYTLFTVGVGGREPRPILSSKTGPLLPQWIGTP